MNIQSSARTPKRPTAQTQPPEAGQDKHDTPCPKDPKDTFFTKAGNALMSGARTTLNEGMLAAKNDPALAMRMSATVLSDQLLKRVEQPVQEGFQKTIVPVMRFALLAGNTFRAHNTLKNPNSRTIDKAIDIGVVASDLVGAVGGIAMLTGGQFAGLGQSLMGFGYAVDAVSHAYRGLTHASDRINVWLDSKPDKSEEKKSFLPASGH